MPAAAERALHYQLQLQYREPTSPQSQKAVSAHFTSEQILPFGSADHFKMTVDP